MPNPALFPIDSMSVRLRDGSTVDIKGKNMEEALQYSSSVSSSLLPVLLCTVYTEECTAEWVVSIGSVVEGISNSNTPSTLW